MSASLEQASELERLLLDHGITTFENEFSQFTDAEALLGSGEA